MAFLKHNLRRLSLVVDGQISSKYYSAGSLILAGIYFASDREMDVATWYAVTLELGSR